MTHTPTPAHQPGMTGGSMDEQRSAENDVTRVEWRVVGDPGGDYPTYRYTFTDEAEARGFIALVTRTGTPWEFGPFLERREVTETPWHRVTPPTSGDSEVTR